MLDCEKVLEELWDWMADQEAHPQYHPIREHLEQCAGCAAEQGRTSELRGVLKEIRENPVDRPSPAFDQQLRTKLNQVIEEEKAESNVVKLEKLSFWRRPLSLVATGAAAVLLVGLVGQRLGDDAQMDPASFRGLANVEEKGPGVVLDRAWQEEDSSAQKNTLEPTHQDDVIPVSTAP